MTKRIITLFTTLILILNILGCGDEAEDKATANTESNISENSTDFNETAQNIELINLSTDDMDCLYKTEGMSNGDIYATSKDGVTYWYSESIGSWGVHSYKGNTGIINLPDTINNIPVTTIYGDTLRDNDVIKSITIGCYMDYISYRAFYSCINLKDVIFRDNYASSFEIGESAFQNCSSLEKIQLPAQTTEIDREAFFNCTNLKEFSFAPNSNNNDKTKLLVEDDAFKNTAIPANSIPISHNK